VAVIEIAPSILSADFARLGAHVAEALAAGARRIHVDVMDGHFVPNITVGPLVVEALRPLASDHGALLDVHLMIAEPERYLDDFARAGADALTVHVEATSHLFRALAAVRALGKAAGVALNPATPLGALEEILPYADLVLVMSVEPGFGGQRFIPGSAEKVARLRRSLEQRGLSGVAVSVDGGIGEATIGAVARAGATIAVAGSAVFGEAGGRSVAENLARLREAATAGAPDPRSTQSPEPGTEPG
jgi:ribulose-phosphate 3-epimerase